MTFKKNNITCLLIIIFSSVLPSAVFAQEHRHFQGILQSKQSRVQFTNLNKKGRLVKQFRADKPKLLGNSFSDEQDKNVATNLNVSLLNTSKTFSFSTNYSNYSQYGFKNKNFEITTAKNTHSAINVGADLLQLLRIRMNMQGHNKDWSNLKLNNCPPLNPKDIVMTSVAYEIYAKGNAVNSSIVLYRTYLTRAHGSTPPQKKRDEYGVFFYNVNHAITHAFFNPVGELGVAVVIGALFFVFGATGIYLLYRRSARKAVLGVADSALEVNSATAAIDGLSGVAEDTQSQLSLLTIDGDTTPLDEYEKLEQFRTEKTELADKARALKGQEKEAKGVFDSKQEVITKMQKEIDQIDLSIAQTRAYEHPEITEEYKEEVREQAIKKEKIDFSQMKEEHTQELESAQKQHDQAKGELNERKNELTTKQQLVLQERDALVDQERTLSTKLKEERGELVEAKKQNVEPKKKVSGIQKELDQRTVELTRVEKEAHELRGNNLAKAQHLGTLEAAVNKKQNLFDVLHAEETASTTEFTELMMDNERIKIRSLKRWESRNTAAELKVPVKSKKVEDVLSATLENGGSDKQAVAADEYIEIQTEEVDAGEISVGVPEQKKVDVSVTQKAKVKTKKKGFFGGFFSIADKIVDKVELVPGLDSIVNSNDAEAISEILNEEIIEKEIS